MAKLITPLVPITVRSIYGKKGPLPKRMALCTPDMKHAIEGVVGDLRSLGHQLELSDLFRSFEMQKQAHLDFVEGRKKAFSPAPGGSMHEAGRAMDISLESMGVPLSKFWEIAKGRGFFPIIATPDSRLSESWHFDLRGSHTRVYEYVRSGKAGDLMSPYTQMAQSGISAVGVKLETVPNQDTAWVQATLIRLGFNPGRIDGIQGRRTNGALRDAGVDPEDSIAGLSILLQSEFPLEYATLPS